MKKNILAVLFDLDGVVVFTDKYHFLAWMKLSKEEGWEFNEKLNERLRGVSRSASLEIILGHNNVELTQEEKELLANRKNDYYIDFLKEINEVDIYPGVIPFIQNLRIKGVKTAICSSSKNARFVLEKLELMKYFDDVVTGDDIHKTKPDPEVFLMAAKSLGIHPMNCLVFEDAQAGIEGALAANMRCIGVGNGDATDLIEEYISCYDDINIEELLVSGYKSKLPRDPWRIIQKEMNPRRNAYWSSVFALSNGYIGIRGSYDETGTDMDTFNSQGMYINSAYCKELHHPKYVRYKGDSPYWHAMINLFDWTSINLYIEQEKFSLLTGRIIDYTRSLDMKKGLLELSVVWESPLGRQIELRTSRMVNMLHRHHAVIYYEVKAVNFTSEICIESWVKHWVPNRQFGERPVKLIKNSSQSGIHLFEYEIDTTGFKIGAAIGHKINGEQEGIGMAQYTNDDFRWIHRQTINQGDAIIFEKHGSFACSFDVPVDRINETVLFDVTNGIKKGYTRLEEEQQDFWEKFWRESDIAVEGNIEDQQALRYSIYQLRQNHPNHNKMSISATGLTGNNYNGHVFWDTEMYMLPFFLYSQPQLVRSLLMYRHHILDKAMERARQMDGKGALFSWMSINGEETNASFECATAQYHINAAVSYGIYQYVKNTMDKEFLYQFGAEILFETALFYIDRGRFINDRDNRFCLNMVCGPDEYGCVVNNNAYTNRMTKFHFEYTVEAYHEMEKECPTVLASLCEKTGLTTAHINAFMKAAECMFENYLPERGIHAQDDSYLYKDPVDMTKTPRNVDIRHGLHPLNAWRIQATKQADVVLMMFVMGQDYSLEVKRANYEFYEPKTVHSSSLSAGIHSIVANEINKTEDAYEYFQQSLYMDLKNLRRNTEAGVHFACLGSTWMAVVNGYAGLRDYPKGIYLYPNLPDTWTEYKMKLNIRGRQIELRVGVDQVMITLLQGDDLNIIVYDKSIKFSEAQPIHIIQRN